jgi:hypothetical protein
MVETRLAGATRCQESQIDAERSDERFCVSGPAAADLIEDDPAYRSGIVLTSVGTERW